MAKKLNSVLGIDIGSQYIKVAEVKTQGRDAVITALGMVPTPEGAVDHTGVYNPEAVAAALKQCIADSGATVSSAVTSIAGQASVLVRTLEVPRMNPTELKDHMQWEISRNIPFAESTIVSDFKPLADTDPNSTNMDVVMAISPQSAIDTMITCVKKAGKQVAAIDVEPMALARSMQMSHGDEYQADTICVIDMGAKTTAINIYQDGKLLMPRQVPIGGEMITKAIADAMTITVSEAEAMKLNSAEIPDSAASVPQQPAFGAATQEFQPYNPFGDAGAAPYNPFGDTEPPATTPAPSSDAPSDYLAPVTNVYTTDMPDVTQTAPTPVAQPANESVRLYNAFAPVLEEIVAEVRRSIDYYRSRGGEVTRIVLAGGGCQLRGFATFLNSAMGLPCDNYDPLRRLNVNAKKVAPDFIETHRQEFAVAVGNGLHILFD